MAANFRMPNLSSPGEGVDEIVQPAAGVLVAQDIVENDFQRPRLEQIGDAFADDRYQSDSQRLAMGPQQSRDREVPEINLSGHDRPTMCSTSDAKVFSGTIGPDLGLHLKLRYEAFTHNRGDANYGNARCRRFPQTGCRRFPQIRCAERTPVPASICQRDVRQEGGGWSRCARRPQEGGERRDLGSHVASGMGTHVIKNSIQYPVAALRHEDLRYHRSTSQGVAPRMKHALVSTVVTRKTTSGKKTVAAGRISGAMGSGVIASAWAPAAAGGAATGGITLGAVAATNVAREFWPQKKNARRRRPGGTLAR